MSIKHIAKGNVIAEQKQCGIGVTGKYADVRCSRGVSDLLMCHPISISFNLTTPCIYEVSLQQYNCKLD